MQDAWFAYWRPEQIQQALQEGLLLHTASEQLSKTSFGDVLWVVGATRGKLFTIGRIPRQAILTRAQARAKLNYYDVWDATQHIIVPEREAEGTRQVGLSQIARRIEFASTKSPRLRVHDGRIDPQQLRAFRKLTRKTAALIEARWMKNARGQTSDYRSVDKALDAWSELDTRREVLARREQHILREIVLGQAAVAPCAICGGEYPKDLVVVAHIKRRADCSDRERRDYASNVIPMCKLGCDELFEKGYIVVRDGVVRTAKKRTTHAVDAYLDRVAGRRCPRWNPRTAPYFRWHARRVAQSD